MKKKDIIEGKIIKTEFPNKGTFICEDQKVTVKGVIDGQTIKGQVTKKRKKWLCGKIVRCIREISIRRCKTSLSTLWNMRWMFLSDGIL